MASFNGTSAAADGGWETVLDAARTTTGKLTLLIVGPSVACLVWFWVAYQTSPLRKYPGPFLAGELLLSLLVLLLSLATHPISRCFI